MPSTVRFGPFELSVETGELRKNGIRLKLSGQPIKVLTLLVARPGQLVTREELQQYLWGGNDYGDFETGLNAAVNRLRDHLNDSATEPKYIETVPGRGYRFITSSQSPPDVSALGPREESAVVGLAQPIRIGPAFSSAPPDSQDNAGMRRHDHIGQLAADWKTARYDTIPPLPQNFVPRHAELEALRQAILSDRDNKQVALVALREMGGVGKTVLAQALCRDRDIQSAFPDGIIWIKVGEKPKDAALIHQMREAARVVGASPEGFDTLDSSSKLLRTLLKDKMVLLVLDDVWEPSPVYHFQPSDDSRFSRLLFTTRDDEIASTVGARSHPLDVLNDQQSRLVLAAYAAVRENDLPKETDGILRECHGLPLALAMIGAMLRNKSPQRWADVLHSLRNADLDAIKIQVPKLCIPELSGSD